MKMRVWYDKILGLITDVAETTSVVLFEVLRDDESSAAKGSFDLNDLDAVTRQRVALYGLNKLLTDRTSGEKDKLVKLDAMQDYFGLLKTGEWSKERVVGAPVVSTAVEALAELQNLTVPQVQAALAQYDKDDRKRILESEKVQAKAKELQEARDEQEVAKLDEYLS